MGEARWFVKIEKRCLRLDHPTRYLSQRTVWIDNGGEFFTAICEAPKKRNYRPIIRVKAVVNRDFLVLLLVGIM